MNKFSDLKPGSYVYVVHNLNWDKTNDYPREYELKKCLVISNEVGKLEEYDMGDRWQSNIVIRTVNYITILFKNIEYQRDYDDFYDNLRNITITPPCDKNGPHIQVFINEDCAKQYIKDTCESSIKLIDEKMEKLNFAKELLEKSINKLNK